jgi:DNA-binding HxlR family transcriptional regulator
VARAGARALTLLATPLNGTILRSLSTEPKRLADLRRECGSPAQTTLRDHLRELEAVAALETRKERSFPGVLECELTSAGRELLFVAEVVEQWLAAAPEGPLQLGSGQGKAAIKALVEGWSSTMLRGLAARPLSLTELSGIISTLSYPSLERRLAAMKVAGMVEPRPSNGRGTPYTVSPWLRRGVAPIAAATRWERRHLPRDSAPITRVDAEAGFLLALPLLRLPAELSGRCRMAVEMSNGKERRLAGAMADVDGGKVAGCSARLERDADAWATGSSGAWLRAVVDLDLDGLELGGDLRLARGLLDGLHEALFRPGRERVS